MMTNDSTLSAQTENPKNLLNIVPPFGACVTLVLPTKAPHSIRALDASLYTTHAETFLLTAYAQHHREPDEEPPLPLPLAFFFL